MNKIFAAVTALLLASPAMAAPFANGSFETSPTNPGSGWLTFGNGDATNLPGWTVLGSVDYVGNYWQTPDGTRSLDLNGSSLGGISQTFDTLAGVTYTVTFALSKNPGAAVATLDVSATGNNAASYLFNAGNSSPNMLWSDRTYSFTATGTTTTLTFLSTTSGTPFAGPALDNVRIAAAPAGVPEPAAFGVLGLGILGLAAGRRRKLA